MKKEKNKKVFYYSDERNDDFMDLGIHKNTVDETFPYERKNPLWKAASAFLYYIVAIPVIWVYERLFLQVKFVNKSALKKLKGKPCFFYGNHTGVIDAFTPNLLSFPRANKIIVSAETVSIKGLKNIVQMVGAIPVPTGRNGMKQFMKAIENAHEKQNVTIYPEAHIWPYYNGVRPFPNTSFYYPVKYDAPIVAFFTAYTKPKGFLSWFRKANVTVYVSDPIYADEGLTGKAKQENLREKAYAFMLEKSVYSDYEVVEYVRNQPTIEKE